FVETPDKWKPATALPKSVSPNYFQVMGVSLTSGRSFTKQDTPQTTKVVLVNEAMARAAWPGEEPIGKHVRTYPYDATAPSFTVIGVVTDTKQSELQAAARPEVYGCYTQDMSYPPRNLVIRTKGEPQSLAAAVRSAIWEVDKDQPVSNIRSMESLVAESVS